MIPYSELDSGIAPVVEWLNARGFSTSGSCEGGEGHAFALPTVQISCDGDLDEKRQALCSELIAFGAKGFSVKTVSMHQRSPVPEPYSYLELEFWSYDTLSYFMS